jgi:hypothetical protein
VALEIEEMEVTPEVAMEWLEGMGKNRRLSESNLDGIILAMRENRWHNDGTPIRFNKAGEMIDGQHRMTAIIATEQTHTFLVIRGVDEIAMTTLDTGKSRSRADVLTIHDPELKDVVSIAAAATICLRWDRGARGNHLRNAYVSNDAFIEFFDANRDAMIHANRIGKRASRALRGVTQQAMSLCAYLFDRIDSADADYFWDRVVDGAGLEKGSPILALRRFFENEARSNRDNVRADIAAAITIKAWNAYREGRDIELLRFRVGGASPERYPEPV